MHIKKSTSKNNNEAYGYILKKNVKSLMPSYFLTYPILKNDQNKL